jgi:hypothetical protein
MEISSNREKAEALVFMAIAFTDMGKTPSAEA